MVTYMLTHFFFFGQLVAQSPPQKTAATWLDLGLNLPKDFPTNEISLFEGLNKARGSWNFVGESTDGQTLNGSLTIIGGVQGGMFPMWRLIWKWRKEEADLTIMDLLAATPREDGFDLLLTRIGPVENLDPNKPQPGVVPAFFNGTWNAETKAITWTEGGVPRGVPIPAVETETSRPKQSFDLIVAADGKTKVQNSKHSLQGQIVSAEATERTAEAPEEPKFLAGKHNFQSADEILDPRIKPWLPQQASDISLFSETGGHFARYKVTEKDFKEFLDKLWEEQGKDSAHDRDSMAGEGEPAKRERMVRRFEPFGWEPLENAIILYSPSKPNGAMTTYYFDREAGIVYHDRGYW